MSTIDLAIDELHKGFKALNNRIFGGQLPLPAILVQNQGNRTRNILGWCTVDKIWVDDAKTIQRYEINITAEFLNRPLPEIMETLLHEMVHLYCNVNDIKDTSRKGGYHNKRFKAEAERVGLTVTFDKSIGWAYTALKPETEELILGLGLNPDAFKIRRKTWGDDEDGEEGDGKRKKGVQKVWRCPTEGCENHTSVIKAKRGKALDVICGKCMQKFVYVEIDPEEEED
ncbi:hypothetical protein B8V81_5074 [Paenibacillus pasadenensis]|uniref:SprT-like domain-containing protein n=1 Tax=Paenibacillus pasadenensis TaxID=217090 RepID=A0A2N5MZM3_9BACL|nr:SprT-like domain-containing protein [Paenibacillus pasadenensis]PLT43534.1 hypothetical protein B8V81_5074 [Paenibacillus pasadenensis]